MKKPKVVYTCQQCGHEALQWYGKCPQCGTWNSMVETVKNHIAHSKYQKSSTPRIASQPQKLSEIKHIEKDRLKSGIGEFDRVMGGGIVPGSVTLLAGDPGIGKSTLLLHVLSKIGGLYVAGEESGEQVKLRAKRLGIAGENISILPETEVGEIRESLEREAWRLSIIDSIQTIYSSELTGMAGSIGQIRYCTEQVIESSKSYHRPVIIIGHVTKEGEIAGPKILEHMVDTVLYLEGERFVTARILRTLKNRFGAVEEVGIFDMLETGLKEIVNPSEIFLSDRVEGVPGSVVTVVLEGTRPILVEIQALVIPSQLAVPRRVATGYDYTRLQLITAILQKRLSLPLSTFDVFVNVSGGFRINEPSADLAVCAAIISSLTNKPIDPKMLVFGEVGLLGEVRATRSHERRMKEATRLGYSTIVSSHSTKSLVQLKSLIQ